MGSLNEMNISFLSHFNCLQCIHSLFLCLSFIVCFLHALSFLLLMSLCLFGKHTKLICLKKKVYSSATLRISDQIENLQTSSSRSRLTLIFVRNMCINQQKGYHYIIKIFPFLNSFLLLIFANSLTNDFDELVNKEKDPCPVIN